MKNKYKIAAMFANDFGKAFDFVREETIAECVEIVKTESEFYANDEPVSMRQRMIDKMKKLGPIK